MTPDKAAVAAVRPDIVKPLEWSKSEPLGLFWRAECAGRSYEVHDDEVAEYKKQQCQADHTARILSALDPAFLARIEALEAENAELRESLRKMHRRAQLGEAATQSFRDRLKITLDLYRANLRPERGYRRFYLFHLLHSFMRKTDRCVSRTLGGPDAG